ncbi:hypothetical protein TSUD_108990 [Trifolium subterraneum]|nr:hypothetical protein TSUD_108990 [Trifolium subterraneum]
MCVHDLIEEGGREWKRSEISEHFNETDAHNILNIPLFSDMKEDVPSWKFSRNVHNSRQQQTSATLELSNGGNGTGTVVRTGAETVAAAGCGR